MIGRVRDLLRDSPVVEIRKRKSGEQRPNQPISMHAEKKKLASKEWWNNRTYREKDTDGIAIGLLQPVCITEVWMMWYGLYPMFPAAEKRRLGPRRELW
jgi:hypothetical protein